MFAPRKIESRPEWADSDDIRIYTISTTGRPVERSAYRNQLVAMKAARPHDWKNTPAFAIFHDGETRRYLILARWDNGNELFAVTAVEDAIGWIEDSAKFSFCLHDMEVFRRERTLFIRTMDTPTPDLKAYRAAPAISGDSAALA
jgi:hypothetical protein